MRDFRFEKHYCDHLDFGSVIPSIRPFGHRCFCPPVLFFPSHQHFFVSQTKHYHFRLFITFSEHLSDTGRYQRHLRTMPSKYQQKYDEARLAYQRANERYEELKRDGDLCVEQILNDPSSMLYGMVPLSATSDCAFPGSSCLNLSSLLNQCSDRQTTRYATYGELRANVFRARGGLLGTRCC